MSNEKENAELGASALRAFMDQFGSPSDPKVGLLLEVLLEELLHAKVVSLLSRSQQTGDQVDRHPSGGLHGNITDDRSEEVKPTPDLGDSAT